MKMIRVLIIDDSALVRQMLREFLESDPSIEVVGEAQDPYVAREEIKRLNPDVLTLDVEMPRMDGVTFLRNLMRLRPMPVVMVSSLTQKGAQVTLLALELGAVDSVGKPKAVVGEGLDAYRTEVITKVKVAASVQVRALEGVAARSRAEAGGAATGRRPGAAPALKTDGILAVGASTGGTEAIMTLLRALPAGSPATVITQHIAHAFAAPFTRRLNGAAAMTVQAACDGEELRPGHVYLPCGNQHLRVERQATRYVCRLSDEEPVNRHRPSVDVMFRSVAESVGSQAIGVLLTGMGKDGAAGLAQMREAGATTLAQDEETSVVWGMPGAAVQAGAVDQVLALGAIPDEIVSLLKDP